MKTQRIFLALLVLIFVTACQSSKKRTIRIVDLMQATNLHFAVAEKKGYFLEEGLDVQLSYEVAGLQAMQKLNTNAVDYAVVVEMNVALRAFEKDDVIILTELSTPWKAIKIIGNKSKGIYKPEDLIGKKIGLLQGVNIHKYMLMFLSDYGIEPNQVEIINMKPTEAANAFKDGSIDATILWEPFVYKLMQDEKIKDDVVLLTNDGYKYWPYQTVLVTSKDNYKNNPEEIEKILNVLIKSDSFIKSNEIEAQQILADMLQLEPKDILTFWDEIEYKLGISDSLNWKMEQEVDWMMKMGLKRNEPIHRNFKDCISNRITDRLAK